MQSSFTELIADEAYYWVYSKFPAWGYFDHPPMIAVLIKAGYLIFQNELGVRLICALMSTMSIMIIESLIEKKNPFVFYTIVLSVGFLQIAGFMAVPDTPLLFFTAVFFYCYRQFLKDASWRNVFFLSCSIALLFYTKYHGLLIVVFAFLSNIRLFTRIKTWVAVLLVILLYTPHLLWQWQHDWMSFRYHLFESNVSAYKFSNTVDYMLGQFLMAGPIAGLILIPASILYKSKNGLEKALKFTLYGIYIIFFVSSFRGKVEPNWTMPVLVPLIILSHQFILERISWFRVLRFAAVISLFLIMAGRIYMVIDLGPDNGVKKRFHNNRSWAETIKSKTKNTPVVFNNSYQRSSLFWFYSGVPSHSQNWYGERRNNYNFWPTESNLLGKEIFIADLYNISTFSDSVFTKKGWVGLSRDSVYSGLGGIQIITDEKKLLFEDTNLADLHCTIVVPEVYSEFLLEKPVDKAELFVGIFKGKEMIKEVNTGIVLQTILDKKKFLIGLNPSDLPWGKFDLRIGIKVKDYVITHNSSKIELTRL